MISRKNRPALLQWDGTVEEETVFKLRGEILSIVPSVTRHVLISAEVSMK